MVVTLCEVGLYDDLSSSLSVCIGFLHTVIRSSLLSRLTNQYKKISIFFDFCVKLDVGFLFVDVVVKSVNFVLVNGVKSVVNVVYPKPYRLSAGCKGAFFNVLHHNICDSNRNRQPMVVVVTVLPVNITSKYNYPDPDYHTLRTTDTPGFKPLTILLHVC